jgi:hypothetical protein
MTIQLSERLKDLDSYFISDIRTDFEDSIPADPDLVWNNSQQLNWISILNPKGCMLKFKTPYFNYDIDSFKKALSKPLFKNDIDYSLSKGFDFVNNYINKQFYYFKGKIYLQAFSKKASIESRLVFYRKIPLDKIKDNTDLQSIYDFQNYDYLEYEGKLFYFNIYLRGYRLYKNDYIIPKIGFDNCVDCAIESMIWEAYSKHVRKIDVKKYVIKLCYLLNRYLNIRGHGHFFENRNYENMIPLINHKKTEFNLPIDDTSEEPLKLRY